MKKLLILFMLHMIEYTVATAKYGNNAKEGINKMTQMLLDEYKKEG